MVNYRHVTPRLDMGGVQNVMANLERPVNSDDLDLFYLLK